MKNNFNAENNTPRYKSLYFKKLTLPLYRNARNIMSTQSIMDISDNDSYETPTNYSEKPEESLNCEEKCDEKMTETEYFYSSLKEHDSEKNNQAQLCFSWEKEKTVSTDNSDIILQYTYLNNVFFQNSKYRCKHLLQNEEKQAIFPRCFQHHRITDSDKNHYENMLPFLSNIAESDSGLLMLNCKVYKNFKCPSSACHNKPYSGNEKSSETFDLLELETLKNLITWRYSRRITYARRQNNTATNQNKQLQIIELLCRLCKGKKWIEKGFFFKHLFQSHGIITSFKPEYGANKKKDTSFGGNEFNEEGLLIEHVNILNINRDLLKYIDVKLLPLPIRLFTDFKKGIERRQFLQCGHCFRFINCHVENATEESCVSPKSLNGIYDNFYSKHLVVENCLQTFNSCYILGVHDAFRVLSDY